jgi:tetratricopeptide (TPR) repeat protein
MSLTIITRRLGTAVLLSAALAVGLGAAGALRLGPPGLALLGAGTARPVVPASIQPLSSAGPGPADRAFGAMLDRHLGGEGGAGGQSALALGYLQQARQTGDPAFYGRAEASLRRAQAASPDHPDVLIGLGTLALARHDFAAALDLGQRAIARAPYRAAAHGVAVDALVELGRYDEAASVLQRMLDLRPDQASYSRASYLRELHGDLAGAVEAMELAVDSGSLGAESTEWARVHLGHLHFARGDLEAAESTYQQTLAYLPGYAHATAGLARVAAARGDHAAAIRLYRAATASVPFPEYLVQLADVYRAVGQIDPAEQQEGLVRAMQRLQAASGVDTDLEAAVLDADRGVDVERAVDRLRAQARQRYSVPVADALAWALHARGDCHEADVHARQALRLGTRDALTRFHAGRIALCLGDEDRARALLSEALATNPYFSLRYASEAREVLRALDPAASPGARRH